MLKTFPSVINMNEDLPFKKNDKVRIKNHITENQSMYRWAITIGNEGWVKAFKEDKFGLPIMFVEWDKNHWTYNGVQDGWTYPEHFDKVETKMSDNDKSEKIKNLMNVFSEALIKAINDDTPEIEEKEEDLTELDSHLEILKGNPVESEEDSKRDKALDIALNRLGDTEAFILIGVDRELDDRAEDGMLSPFVLAYGDTEEALLVAQGFCSSVGVDAHNQLIFDKVTELYKNRKNN